eukprot:755317-Hanusia_phi.AAC.9
MTAGDQPLPLRRKVLNLASLDLLGDSQPFQEAVALNAESVRRVARWIQSVLEVTRAAVASHPHSDLQHRGSKSLPQEELTEEDHRALEVFKVAGLRAGCHVSKVEQECLDGKFLNSDWWLRSTGRKPKRKVGEGEELTAQDVSDDDLEPGGLYLYSAEEVAMREQQLDFEEEGEEEEEEEEGKSVKRTPPRKRSKGAKRATNEMGTLPGRSSKVNYEALDKLLKEFG